MQKEKKPKDPWKGPNADLFIMRKTLIDVYVTQILSNDPLNDLILLDERRILFRFLSDIFSSLSLIPKEKANRDILRKAKEEIGDLFYAVKKVGFSGRTKKSEDEWRNEALKRFDDSKTGYTYIRREHLTERSMYTFRPGHERGDFTERLLQKVLPEIGFKKMARETLREMTLKEKSKPKEKPRRSQVFALIKMLEARRDELKGNNLG